MGIAAVGSQDAKTVRGAWVAMELIGWYVIVPSALASLLTGVLMALGTKWGLFRHYWVLLSFLLTTLGTVALLAHMPTLSSLAAVAREANRAGLNELGGNVVLHPVLALVLLFVLLVLNVYKPSGMTRLGRRKQDAERRKRSRASQDSPTVTTSNFGDVLPPEMPMAVSGTPKTAQSGRTSAVRATADTASTVP